MKLKTLGLIMLAALTLFSCNKNTDKKGIELNVKILPTPITDLLYAKMSYQIKLTDQFAGLTDDYRFFVHFWCTKKKEMLLQDDHSPERPFSQWKKGETISYSREIFIPQFIDEFDIDFEGYEEIVLTVGLYKPSDNKSTIELARQVLQVYSASTNAPGKTFDEGWYQTETDLTIKDPEERKWQWTSKHAVCIIENPRKESLLIIRGGVDKAIIPDQKITIKLNNTILEEFIPESAKFSKKYIITPAMMGNEDEIKLIIDTDKTFIPASLTSRGKDPKDIRELGVQIYFLYFRETLK